MNEFMNLYKGKDLPEPEFQYKDFAAWQNELSEKGIIAKQGGYWLDLFKGEIPVLNMPIDHKRPPVRSYEGDNIVFEASKRITENMGRIASESGTTMFMVLLAAYNLLLFKYSGQKDIIVGTPVSGRSHKDTEKIVGMFVNTVAMRNYPSADKTFGGFLEEVKSNALKAYENQDYQFEELVDELKLERNVSRNPIFDTMLVYQNVGSSEIQLDGLVMKPLEFKNNVSQFDMTLRVIEGDGKLTFDLGYSTKLFYKDTMERLSGHLLSILERIAANPHIKLADIEIMTEKEKELVLKSFNKTCRGYDTSKTIHEVFEKNVKRVPENIALESEGESLTYRQLNSSANSLANLLLSKGIKPENIVGIMMERSIEVVISILAILKAGGAYMPIDPEYPWERINYMLGDAKPAAVILKNASHYEKLLGGYQGQVIDLEVEGISTVETFENPVCVNTPSNLAYVIYTSGSSGKPKGVMVEHQGVVNLANWQQKIFDIGASSRISQFATFSFDGAVGEMAMALLNGSTLVMLNRKTFNAEEFIDVLNTKKINVLVITPALLARLNPSKLTNGKELSVVSVGEECPVELGLKWSHNCNFINAYGPTEYTVYSHLWRGEASDIMARTRLPIGTPMDNTHTYIFDQDLKPVPIGVAGEIYISGHGIARGYLNQFNKTSMTFMLNPFVLGKDKIYEEVEFQASERNADFEADCHKLFLSGKRKDLYNDISKEKLVDLISGFDEDIVEKTKSMVDEYDPSDPILKCLFRYFLEGMKKSYRAYGIDESLLKFILRFDSFTGMKGVDFGLGNGEVMVKLKKLGAEVTGFDLSPSFVHKGREMGLNVYQARCDVSPENFEKEFGIKEGSQDFVISNLVLDRLENPLNFLQNFLQALKPGGKFALQTLLPVIGVDDEDVEEPIVYTTPQNQITFGSSAAQDKLAIVTLLRNLGARDVKLSKFTYTIVSYTGAREYECWSFFGEYDPIEVYCNPENRYERFYKTGNVGRYLPDGNIEFIGRVDQQVKIRGFRIETGEIESKLLSHANVKEAVVVVNTDDNENKQLCAYFVSDKELYVKELRGYLAKELPDYMIPGYFIQVDKIPVNLNGKLDKKALPKPGSNINTGISYSKPRNEVEEMIVGVWKEVLGIEMIGIDDDFFLLGGDSIKAVQVMSNLSSEFEITMNDIFQYRTINELSGKILYKKNNLKNKILEVKEAAKGFEEKDQGSSLDTQYMEKYLDEIKIYERMDITEVKTFKGVLVAGATGYLGLHILHETLENTESKVYALVRGSDKVEASERLVEKLQFHFGKGYAQKYHKRLILVNGDITLENFGLDWDRYIGLANEIDCVINAAANVKHYGVYSDFYDINVKGTERLLSFSMIGRLKDYNHISTLSVASGKVQGVDSIVFSELDCDVGQVSDNFYVRTKIEAEKAVLKARKSGLVANVFRVGSLVFNSDSGRFQQNIGDNGFYSIVKSLIKLGIVPEGDRDMFDFSYVDATTKAIMMLIDKKSLENGTYHIYNPVQVSPKKLGELLIASGYTLSFKDNDKFLDCLYHNYDDKELRPFVESILVHTHMLEDNESTSFDIVSDKTRLILERLGFKWDEMNIGYMKKMMEHCEKVGFISGQL